MNSNQEHNLEKFKTGTFNWKYFFYFLLFLLALLLMIRACNFLPNEYYSNTNNRIDSLWVDVPVNGEIVFPDNPNHLTPIDTSQIIELPDDALKRKIVGNLLNIYLHKDVNIQAYSQKLIESYPNDSIEVVYYAEEYKRVQISLQQTRRDFFKDELKKNTNEVKFVCYESVLSNTDLKGSDVGFSNPDYTWFYEQIGLFNAWEEGKGSKDVVVAVIDDSFDSNHPELANQFAKPWNVFEYSNILLTYGGKLIHGTHVAGTVAGNINNGVGISGVAPLCKIMPIQIADEGGRMTTTSILDGIFYALKNGADVINLSLGLNIPENLTEQEQIDLIESGYLDEAEMWDEVYNIASEEGVVIVQASGNSNVLAKIDPMKRSAISLVVGASNRSSNKASFSNYGPNVDVYAPGVDIYSSTPNASFQLMDGTSMASPIVAGCIALIKSKNQDLTVNEIKQLIESTGTPISNQNGKLIQIDKILSKI